MSENPYLPPSTEFAATGVSEPTGDDATNSWICAIRSLLFSIPGGVTAGVVWGSGAMSMRISGWLAYVMIGAIFGLSIALTVSQRRLGVGWVRRCVIVIGGGLGVGIITAVHQVMRSLGWHLVGQQFPWIWAFSTMVPILASVAIVSLTLRFTRILSLSQSAVFAFLTLPITVIAWGAVDHLMLPSNSFAAHYCQRVIMFTAWFVSVSTILSHLSSPERDPENTLLSR